MITILFSFLICGLICGIGQLLADIFKFTPGVITSIFVIIGAFLDLFGIYDYLIKIGHAGAMLPITSFGHSLSHASYNGALTDGALGILTHMFDTTSAGITLVIILGVTASLFFRPKS